MRNINLTSIQEYLNRSDLFVYLQNHRDNDGTCSLTEIVFVLLYIDVLDRARGCKQYTLFLNFIDDFNIMANYFSSQPMSIILFTDESLIPLRNYTAISGIISKCLNPEGFISNLPLEEGILWSILSQ